MRRGGEWSGEWGEERGKKGKGKRGGTEKTAAEGRGRKKEKKEKSGTEGHGTWTWTGTWMAAGNEGGETEMTAAIQKPGISPVGA